uniref:NADH-ubiquinone oxidoreductase chain 6 n=1 Tax=Coleoptera sp. ACP-2013 TaxID=2485033 RepID=A0A3G3MEU7_9COLE|nr:NADH dehydrogenase subunit 6 [Coleoptera sp. ACP-2013]
MLMNLFFMNWMLSMMFLTMNHPLSLGCILLSQTILISLISSLFYLNFWYSYILFLIMIGGMLIMFIYMTSIASNEKFKLPNKNMLIFIGTSIMFFIMMIMLIDNYFNFISNKNYLNFNQFSFYKNFSLIKFFNYPNFQILILLMAYLLITLIAIVKIINKKKNSLRQFS